MCQLQISWVGLEELEEFVEKCRNEKTPLSPWFKLMLESGKLRHWWTNLDSLNEVKQPEVIHNL